MTSYLIKHPNPTTSSFDVVQSSALAKRLILRVIVNSYDTVYDILKSAGYLLEPTNLIFFSSYIKP